MRGYKDVEKNGSKLARVILWTWSLFCYAVSANFFFLTSTTNYRENSW